MENRIWFTTRLSLFILFYVIGLFCFASKSLAQAETPASNTISSSPTPDISSSTGSSEQQIQDIQNKIADLQKKIGDLQGQEKTLSSQIAVMNGQIKLTEYQIEVTKQEIINLEQDIDTAQKKISSLEIALADLTKVLFTRIVATYEIGTSGEFQTLLASSSISDFFKRANYLRLVQEHDKKVVYIAVQAKNDYANQKQIFEDKRKKVVTLQKQLQEYTKQLDSDKQVKQTLLSETQGSEANFQTLLTQAQKQLSGFSSFAVNQGGATILSNQTYCDDWGCYYNQRDSQWGNLALNNTQYTIASDGCLITSIAMIYTHYGHRDVTPISINSNSGNFASYYPAYLKYTISANGVSSQRIGDVIDANLSSGIPVVVGIRYANGDTHFVVLKSGSGGVYIMDDPFTPNGHDIAFTSKYSLNSIFEVDKVVF